MPEFVKAVLDRPTAASLGMLGVVIAREDGGLRTDGVLGSQGGPITETELEDLIRGGHALRVRELAIDPPESAVAALWVGNEFAEHTSAIPVPPLPQQTLGHVPTGTFWVAPARHVWRVLDSWIVQAFRRVVQSRDDRLALLMTSVMPDREETRAARWLTSSPGAQSRELEWWARLDRDRGIRNATPDTLSAAFRELVHRVEVSPPSTVLGFCAPAMGGDTEIAQFVAKERGLIRISFGRWLREKAIREGREPRRRVLQALGQQMIERRGELSFCLDVLEDVSPRLHREAFLIDGIRHLKVRESVLSLVGPDRFFFAFVDRPVQVREERLRAEEHLSSDEVRQILADPTEAEIPQLRQLANIELDGLHADVEGRRLMARVHR